MMKPVITSLCTTAVLFSLSAFALAKPGWTENYEKGLAEAKKENKLVLVDFTGSDWCGWCIKLDKEVFSKAKFKDYAKDKLVLVEVDFPQLTPLSKSKQAKHDALKDQYGVIGFPTVVVLNSEGKKVGQLGYVEGGPEAWIAELEKVTAAVPAK